MERIRVDSLEKFIKVLSSDKTNHPGFTVLYRGQASNWPLLPNLARGRRNEDLYFCLDDERRAIRALKRASGLLLDNSQRTNWDWLVLGQHFGLITRLLDWSTNPLIALWFACCNETYPRKSSYVYRLETILEEEGQDSLPDPFVLDRTVVYFPKLDNKRVSAQSGHFTAFGIYDEFDPRFIPLQEDRIYSRSLVEIEIRPAMKQNLLNRLSQMGINSATIFADFEGLCRHLNWSFFIPTN